MRVVLLVLLATSTACGSNKPAQESPPSASASLLDCDKVAAHVGSTFAAAERPNARATPADVQSMVATRCNADAWSDETKQCLFAIKTIVEGRSCATSMTDEQRQAIRTDARALRTANAPSTEDDPSVDWIRHVIGEVDRVPH